MTTCRARDRPLPALSLGRLLPGGRGRGGRGGVGRALRSAIEHDQVRQAYLFAGPRGTGKTSMARILAKALNADGGPNADFDPTTPIARAIAAGAGPGA